jgi:hypothetical protein
VKFRRQHSLILIGLLIFPAGLLFACRSNSSVKTNASSEPSSSPITAPQHRASAEDYKEARAAIEAERAKLAASYARAATDQERTAVINRARETLTKSAHLKIFDFWYGTPWDFNGTTETPGQGKIACGYFVTTVLRDLGFKVQRAKLAQQASENIILSLTTDSHIKRFRQKPLSDFVEAVRNWGAGLYIVGLDIHVGFILNDDGHVYFIHSSYMDPLCVIKEDANASKVLASSKYRVLGKISADDQLILKWLQGDQFNTHLG